jgi:hypothetical protein
MPGLESMPSTPGNRVLRKENRADRLAEWETHSFSAASLVVPLQAFKTNSRFSACGRLSPALRFFSRPL